MEKPIYIIDGDRFDDLESFYDEVERSLIPDVEWGRNPDSFNDILRGGVGLPRTFILVWKNSKRSRQTLGYEETVKFWQEVKARSIRTSLYVERLHHPETKNIKDEILITKILEKDEKDKVWLAKLDDKIAAAQQGQGTTVFDWLIDMIRDDRKDVEFRPE